MLQLYNVVTYTIMTPPCDSAHLCDVIIDCSYKMDIQFNMFAAMRTHPTVSGYN